MVIRIDRVVSGNRGALAGDVLCLATIAFYLCDRFWDRPLKCFSDVPEPIGRTPAASRCLGASASEPSS